MANVKISSNKLNLYISQAKEIGAAIAGANSFLDVAAIDFLVHAEEHGDFTLASKFMDSLTVGSTNGLGNLRKAFVTFFTAYSPAVLRTPKGGNLMLVKDKSDDATAFDVATARLNPPSSYKKAATPVTIEGLIAQLASYSFADRRDALVKKAESAGFSAAAIATLSGITSVAKAKAASK